VRREANNRVALFPLPGYIKRQIDSLTVHPDPSIDGEALAATNRRWGAFGQLRKCSVPEGGPPSSREAVLALPEVPVLATRIC
jgi:hypothetical protein